VPAPLCFAYKVEMFDIVDQLVDINDQHQVFLSKLRVQPEMLIIRGLETDMRVLLLIVIDKDLAERLTLKDSVPCLHEVLVEPELAAPVADLFVVLAPAQVGVVVQDGSLGLPERVREHVQLHLALLTHLRRWKPFAAVRHDPASRQQQTLGRGVQRHAQLVGQHRQLQGGGRVGRARLQAGGSARG